MQQNCSCCSAVAETFFKRTARCQMETQYSRIILLGLVDENWYALREYICFFITLPPTCHISYLWRRSARIYVFGVDVIFQNNYNCRTGKNRKWWRKYDVIFVMNKGVRQCQMFFPLSISHLKSNTIRIHILFVYIRLPFSIRPTLSCRRLQWRDKRERNIWHFEPLSCWNHIEFSQW